MVARNASTRLRSLLAVALSVAASIAVALFALEAGLRLWDGIPLFSGENFVAKRIDLIRANTGPAVHDELLGWRLRDNFGSGGFMTGELGIRMNENAVRPLPRGAILAVGDSFTAGSEVDNAESYPAHLEELLGTPVLNAGSGGWGVDQMVLQAEKLIPILKPTTLIVGILDQDILRNNFRIFGGGYKPYFTIENGELVLQGTPVPRFEHSPRILGFWHNLLSHSYLADWLIQRTGLMPIWIDHENSYEQIHEDGPEVSRLLMERIGELGHRLGIRVIVVIFYGGDYVSLNYKPADWVTPTIEGARAGGALVVDMFPILRKIYEADPEELKRYYVMHDSDRVYGHMSSELNLLVAKAIQSALLGQQ